MKSLIRSQMVYEDALFEQPKYAITLTTRSPVWDGERYSDSKRQLLRKMRSEFGRVEMLEFMEQTSGKAPRAGGKRRGHGHNLVKCDVEGAVRDFERLIVPEWRRSMGAWQINVSELQSAGGAVAYLTLNLAFEKGKAVQAPTDLPKGTRTLRATQAYWAMPYDVRIQSARDHHALRRLAHAVLTSFPADSTVHGDYYDLCVQAAWDKHQSTEWTLWRVDELGGVLAPIGPVERRNEFEDAGFKLRGGKLVNCLGEVVERFPRVGAPSAPPFAEGGGA